MTALQHRGQNIIPDSQNEVRKELEKIKNITMKLIGDLDEALGTLDGGSGELIKWVKESHKKDVKHFNVASNYNVDNKNTNIKHNCEDAN